MGGPSGHTSLSSSGMPPRGHADEKAATPNELHSRKIKNWLMTLLRFAVTRDNTDRMSVLELARELDRRNAGDGDSSFSYFVRTSTGICNAIIADLDSARQATLVRFLNCIDDRRLRAALEAATDCRPVEPAAPKLAKRKREDLWRGLRPR